MHEIGNYGSCICELLGGSCWMNLSAKILGWGLEPLGSHKVGDGKMDVASKYVEGGHRTDLGSVPRGCSYLSRVDVFCFI